ncbi:MAG: hypothetical protein R3C05_15380 [Pirellulaceae bacterium]
MTTLYWDFLHRHRKVCRQRSDAVPDQEPDGKDSETLEAILKQAVQIKKNVP